MGVVVVGGFATGVSREGCGVSVAGIDRRRSASASEQELCIGRQATNTNTSRRAETTWNPAPDSYTMTDVILGRG